MTPAEYVQLKAFARIDGVYLVILWVASFVCYVCGLSRPLLGDVGLGLAVASPVFALVRLRKFRDYALDGVISFRRAMAYYMLMFLYASLLFCLAQIVYFEFIDGGYLMRAYTELFSSEEVMTLVAQYGLSRETIDEAISQMEQTSSVALSVNIMAFNIAIGIILSLPAALMTRRAANQTTKS